MIPHSGKCIVARQIIQMLAGDPEWRDGVSRHIVEFSIVVATGLIMNWFYNERQVAIAKCGDVEDYPI